MLQKENENVRINILYKFNLLLAAYGLLKVTTTRPSPKSDVANKTIFFFLKIVQLRTHELLIEFACEKSDKTRNVVGAR